MDPSVANSSKSQLSHFESCLPSLPAVFLLIAAYVIVMLVGLLGNLCLIIIIKKQKESQSVTNILIANLSLSDIFICVMCIPFTVAYTLMDYWVFGEAMCKISAFVQSVSVTVSTFSLVLIAVERYQLIVNPRGCKPSISHAFWGIIFIWAFSLIISTPFFIFHQVTDEPFRNLSSHSDIYKNKVVCIEVWPSIEERRGFTTTMLVFQYFFPLGFIFICYVKIFVCLQKRHAKVDKIRENEIRLNESKRINIMLISIVVTFGACWLPLNIFNMVFDWNHEALINCHHNVVFTLCHLVAMISICINPVFYGFLNKNFQKDLVVLLHNFRCFESQELYENIALSTMNTDVSKGSFKLNNMPANI
ncbi:neuropeptide Y receptor type 6-like [Rhineura floridana]|uniref:neuropeptide Y receptor type 6-like n=1 Tax=Rhineura floridana TaxID=261503 RepID=UPI002AC81FD3|nr:neuropeptide Y receptor type 6-like [Rhineura floridana]XP_061473195.1 neuropeptide Y receptor type 6-like [Rhineura floridana]XP_061473196.1 neuropeptide Y receptor type 6-like [Rhineura floridana]XP_061473197.1 neuropeptide Y receptor type 6-like [Rhineura floridana]XP_061473198.1 neuropeptide Y receptor type 6-like [Rhineura floridana]